MRPNILLNRFLRNMLFLFLSYLFIHSCLFAQPAAPNLISPADLVIKRPINDSLKWSTVAAAAKYKLQVSTDSLFLTTFQDVNINSPDTVKLVSGMSYGVKYYWRVRAINAASDSSVWSTKRSFTTTPIITVTFPNGLENLKVDSTYNITWFSGGVSNVKIEYTTDGAAYTIIKADTTGNSFPWQIPNTPSTTCKIRITSLSDATITDRSDSTFTIMTPSLSITRPDVLESWKVDSTYNITWSSPGLAGNVKIEYSTNSGSTYTTITASTPSGSGSYPWSVPNFPSVNCKVRITHLTYPAFSDSSNVLFTIMTPSITVISPNGGEQWKVDSAYTIRWSTTGLSGNGKIEYSINGGSSYTTIIASTPLAAGSYAWTTPNAPSGNCKVRISHSTYTSIADSSNATFTIMTPSIVVTFPNGGENLKIDSTYNITWNSSGLAGNVKIQYSINGGGLYTDIVASTPITSGSYPWTIPNAPSGTCLIKISQVTYNTINDVSNATFTIMNPSITITSPTGGETWSVDSSYNLTWTSSGLAGNVKIDYSVNGGGSYTNIVASTPITSGSYIWTTPYVPSVNCKIRISHVTHSSLLGTSGVFTILTPSITVTSPNGSESWDVGTNHEITWTRSGLAGNAKIEYSTDNGTSYSVITGSTPVSNGHYTWTIPATASPDCKVKISHILYPTVADSSNITFTINPPPLAVTSPNGGESWVVGSIHNITWAGTTIIGNLKIEYSTNSGTSYTTIATGVAANLGTYSWTIPNTPTGAVNSCFVKLTHETLVGLVDSSNAGFRIPTPVLTIVTPNGGQSWKVDSTYYIQWTSIGSSGKVKIEYTTNNGGSYTTLVDSISSSAGTLAWTIPFTPSAQCRVRITDIVYPTITATSSATFTIPTPSITVTSPNGGESWLGGSPHVITWTNSVEVRNVKIEYTINNGGAWISIIDSIPSAPATYNWTIPNTPSAQCRVRIKHTYYSSVVDSSDNLFTIPNNTIDLTSPNGGEGWQKGSVQNITWTSTNITNVKIEYTSDNGTGWNTIIASTPAAGGTYSWTVPNTLSALYKVRISDADQSYPIDTSNATFKVTDILLQSPNGSEQWQSGKTQNIIWTQTNITNIKIEYSIDNGSSWSVVIASTPAGTGTYPWTLPNTPSNQCLVKIRDADNIATVDSSDAVFTIMRLDVTSPNGGEYWQANSVHNITWLSAGVNNVRLQYSADSGSTWTTIITSTPAAAGSYSWTVPAIASNICKIRILNADYLPVNDVSDNLFSIFNLRLTYPVGGELLRAGSTKRITWTSSSITNLKIEYSINDGASWSTVIASTTAATGFYNWTIPNTPSTDCRIRISDQLNSNARDSSSNKFTIYAGTLALTAPNGGESWLVGTTNNITWTSSGVDSIKILYSTNNGLNYNTVLSSTPAVAGSYSWTVPNTPSNQCYVKVYYLTDTTLVDSSNAIFTIPAPTISVTSPNGGETWNVGSTKNITWTSANVSNVKISLSTNSGASYSTIIASTPAAAGTYSWRIPNTPSNTCKIKISVTGDSTVADSSNAVFTIPAPSLTVTSPNGGENWKVGSTHNITWNSSNIDSVRISYSTNGGTNYYPLVTTMLASTGTYSWRIPNKPSTQCIIKISIANDTTFLDTNNTHFTIPTPSITVTSPNGAESWIVASTHNITWTSTNIDSVKISYSTNNGSTFYTVVAQTWGDSGTYSWTIPHTPSDSCLVKICIANDTTIADSSNNMFRIPTPTITVVAPNGGEIWKVSSTKNITWTSSGVTKVKLEYSINGGASYLPIKDSVNASLGTYSWTVANFPSATCKVRISEVGYPTINDISNANFEIKIASISILAPRGGESWLVGTTHDISWSVSNVDSLKIEFSTNGGSTYTTLIAKRRSDSTPYTWTIPNSPSANCKIRISDLEVSLVADSSSVFTIPTPLITITQPNGGESWAIGSFQSIDWTATGLYGYIKIEYSTNGGSTYIIVKDSLPASAASYVWTVPSTPSNQCKVKITSLFYPTIADSSNAVFSIPTPGITITSPNGGEKWDLGTAYNITWTTTNYTGNVKIELSNNGGSTYSTLIASQAASPYSWTTTTASANCKIRISFVAFPTISDSSNAVFQVIEQALSVTTPNGSEICPIASIQSVQIQTTYGNNTNMDVSYSTNNGSTYTFIATVKVMNFPYSWTIPNAPSTFCKIKVALSAGGTADSSDAVFTISLAKPTTPTLSSPANSATNVAINPTFGWTAATGTHTITYELEYSTVPGFSANLTTVSNIATNSQAVSGLSYYTNYYWRVRAKNSNAFQSTYGDWSSSYTFRTTTLGQNISVAGSTTVRVVSPQNAVGDNEIVTLSADVFNNSATATSGSLTLYYYISTDATITTADTLLGSTTVPIISNNSQTPQQLTLTFPTNIPINERTTYSFYYIGFIINGQSFCITNGPHLVHTHCLAVTDVSLSPLTIEQGQPLTLTTTVKNLNPAQVGNTQISNYYVGLAQSPYFFISLPATFPPFYVEDVAVKGTLINNPNPIGNPPAYQTYTFTKTINIPNNLTPGNWYVVWYLDGTGCGYTMPNFFGMDILPASQSPLVVTPMIIPVNLKGDQVAVVTPAPVPVYPSRVASNVVLKGDKINISNFKVTDELNNVARDFKVSFYIGDISSGLPNWGYTYKLGDTSAWYPALTVPAPQTKNNLQFTVPLNVPDGDNYYISWWIDSNRTVSEETQLFDNKGSFLTNNLVPLIVRTFFFFVDNAQIQMHYSGSGTSVDVPITVNNLANENVTSFNFALKYDSKVIKALPNVNTIGTLCDGWSISANPLKDGLLMVEARGNTPISGKGKLLKLKFDVLGLEDQTSPLEFTHFLYNENKLLGVQNGSITVKSIMTNISKLDMIPLIYSLEQNYPNPFNPTTTIRYSVPEETDVTIKLFDVIGREIKTLTSVKHTPGWYELSFDAKGLPSGMYFYVLSTHNNTTSKTLVKKMLLLK